MPQVNCTFGEFFLLLLLFYSAQSPLTVRGSATPKSSPLCGWSHADICPCSVLQKKVWGSWGLAFFYKLLILWSGRPGSNRRHSAWEADVLPLNYSRPLKSIIYEKVSPLLSNLLSKSAKMEPLSGVVCSPQRVMRSTLGQ